MKKSRHLLLGILLLSSFISFAQQAETTVWLKSGPIKLPANLSVAAVDQFNKELNKTNSKTVALLQFHSLPTEMDKKVLEAAGISILSYVSDRAYTVAITKQVESAMLQRGNVSAIISLSAAQKMDEQLSKGIVPQHAVKQSGTVDVRIIYVKTYSVGEIQALLKQLNINIVSDALKQFNVLDLRIEVNRLPELASMPFIEFVQAVPPADEPLNNRSRAGARANILNATVANGGKALNGEGIVIGVGDNANIQLNTDFAGRILATGTNSLSAHGVHVTGTAAGAGIINEMYRGYAPKSGIVSEYFSYIISRASVYVQDYGMVLTNNSYGSYFGCTNNGLYETTASVLDGMAATHPKLLNVFAAGNSGGNTCSPYATGYHTVLGGYQSAKNVLSVGNTTDTGWVITPSSKGPVKDGRLKPEITAMGTDVISNWATNFYIGTTGTSMAAPAVSGGAALLYQRYRQLNGNADPNSGLIKALLCNGATDKGPKGPDFSYGFGWMNLLRSVDMIENNRFVAGSVGQGANINHVISVPANTAQLKVMLYWHDPAGSPASTKALVNNLDLEVIDLSSITNLPQVLDTNAAALATPSTTGVDHVNNIEQVVIDNPPAGNYTVRVKGTAIAVNPSQEYFVVYDAVPVQLKITAPAGGEGWATSTWYYDMMKIHWEADGYTSGTVTLEYSLNDGVSWFPIATGVDINRKVFGWWVPNETSSGVRIRITKEGTGESNTSNAFTITSTPVVQLDATQCEGYTALTWSAIPGVTDYEVFRLYGDQMISVDVTTSTNYTLGGLSPDSTYWFGVSARVAGKVGRRSVAVSRQPNTGTCAGTISDNDIRLVSILSPKSGRKYTSTELTSSTPVTIQFKNLDDAPVSSFKVRYSLNGAAWVEENINTTVAAGALYNHTFGTTLNLSAVGSYTFTAEVINNNTDPVSTNNTLTTVCRQINNEAITLDFLDDLESSVAATYGNDTIGFTGLQRYDFENSLPIGRVRTFANSGLSYSGTKSIVSEATRPPLGAPYSTNYTIGTFNLGGYNASNNDVRLDFRYLFNNQLADAANKIWVRGTDTNSWIEVYSYNNTKEEYVLSQSLEIADALINNAQNFSTSFQVRWGHLASSPTNYTNHIFSVDNIRMYEVFNDMQMISIDTPKALSCGLDAAVPMKVTIRNSHNAALTNIPVKYTINGGAVVEEIIPSIAGNTTIQYTFLTPLNLSNAGAYTIKAFVDFSSDSFRDNDTTSIALHNAPLITSYPYLQDFESGDGYFYPQGTNTSWQWGIPGSAKINKAANGNKVWKTNLSGNYNDLEASYLYSPCFNLTSLTKPTLSFSVALDLEDCGGSLCDGVKIEYTTNGTTWLLLDSAGGGSATNWYNKSYKVWSVENYTRWHVATVSLPDTLDQIRFRFIMTSDEAVTYEGIAIDDIHVYDNTKGIYTGPTLTAPVTQSVSGSNWIDFESGGKLIASVQPAGQNLGTTDAQVYINTAGVRNDWSQYYHDRNITIKPATTTTTDSVSVRFYFLDSESEALISATGCARCTKPASAYELGVSKYSDTDDAFENGTISDNNQGVWSFIISDKAVKVPFDKGYYAEFKVKDFSEFWLNNGGFNRSSPLPVTLTSFIAKKAGANDVMLTWTTANESDIARYEIELAVGNDALAANRFSKIGMVNSLGNSAAEQRYNFLDTELAKNSVRYYRLKIIERDGSFTYSPVRSVLFSDAVTWQVFPNPSSGIFQFVYQVPSGETIEAEVYDAKGRRVERYTKTGTGFIQKLTIDLLSKGYASGMYLLNVNAAGRTQSFKLYKQ